MSIRVLPAVMLIGPLAGCSLAEQHDELLQRAAVKPGGPAIPVRRMIDDSGATCRYGDGSVVHSPYVATRC